MEIGGKVVFLDGWGKEKRIVIRFGNDGERKLTFLGI